MTRPGPAVTLPLQVAAVGLVLALGVASILRAGAGDLTAGSLWTVSAATAVGTALALLGAVAVATGQFLRADRPTGVRLTVVGAVVALVGVGVALARLGRPYDGSGTVRPVTVGVGLFARDTDFRGPTHVVATTLVVVAAGLVVLTLAGVLARRSGAGVDPARAVRPVQLTALVGAALIGVGGSSLPWVLGPSLAGVPLWGAGAPTAVAAGLTVLVGVVTALLLQTRGGPRRGLPLVLTLVAGLAAGAVVAARLPLIHRTEGWYAYAPLTDLALPSSAALHGATFLVLAGTGLVVLAGLATVSLGSAAAPLASRAVPTSRRP